jgi:hypothetical protein
LNRCAGALNEIPAAFPHLEKVKFREGLLSGDVAELLNATKLKEFDLQLTSRIEHDKVEEWAQAGDFKNFSVSMPDSWPYIEVFTNGKWDRYSTR